MAVLDRGSDLNCHLGRGAWRDPKLVVPNRYRGTCGHGSCDSLHSLRMTNAKLQDQMWSSTLSQKRRKDRAPTLPQGLKPAACNSFTARLKVRPFVRHAPLSWDCLRQRSGQSSAQAGCLQSHWISTSFSLCASLQ